MPPPAHIDEAEVVRAIDPAKDVEVKKKSAGRSNGHPPAKRAAKKTTKKAP